LFFYKGCGNVPTVEGATANPSTPYALPGTTVSYQCQEGSQAVPSVITCQADATWSHYPSCLTGWLKTLIQYDEMALSEC